MVKEPGEIEAQAGKQQPPLQAKQNAVANANYKNNEQAAQLNFKTGQKQKVGLASVEQKAARAALVKSHIMLKLLF
ncbi:hypothetical protein GCM10011613_36430 [Cellvibrio zantedeschiae]|uniref:Uncharacterized protein n=1 Tax=Cellvibrio zantedeschiae TaxID=1237077 RepID=A0ABQ3BAG3_9GAMM|nr:hypothetical protein GCM10011613_36430 [Cellvibrio zantedeschiae]